MLKRSMKRLVKSLCLSFDGHVMEVNLKLKEIWRVEIRLMLHSNDQSGYHEINDLHSPLL